MRLIIDLPDGLVRRIRELEFRGRYGSAEEFIWAAVENQLLLENRGSLVALTAGDESGGQLLSRPAGELSTVEAQPASDTPLWGMINRFLPVKVGTRVLANLLADGAKDWILLEEFEHKAGAIAREFGLFLQELDVKIGRKMEQRLSVGLPVGRRAERSLARYEEHFLAATPEGALRKLGLAATSTNLVGEEVIGITKEGVEFGNLSSPPLDEGDYTVPISKEEAEFLKGRVRSSVPGEWALWKEIFNLLGEGGLSQEGLRSALGETKGWEGGTLATMMAGVLARVKELGLVRSRGRGPNAMFEAVGKEVLAD
jgi:Arc/MetJ-type ribon-helix-helix transcriptional regulator